MKEYTLKDDTLVTFRVTALEKKALKMACASLDMSIREFFYSCLMKNPTFFSCLLMSQQEQPVSLEVDSSNAQPS